MGVKPKLVCIIIVAERLSARQLIVQRGAGMSACVCRYIYIYVSFGPGGQYGEGHTSVLYVGAF